MSEEYFAEVLRDKRAGKPRPYPADGMQPNGDLYKNGLLLDHVRGPGGLVVDSYRFKRRAAGVSFREQYNATEQRQRTQSADYDGCPEGSQ